MRTSLREAFSDSSRTNRASRYRFLPRDFTLHPTAHTLHPTPYTLHPSPYTLHLKPYTLHATPYTLHPSPFTLHPTPRTLHPTPYTLHPTPHTLHPKPVWGGGLDSGLPSFFWLCEGSAEAAGSGFMVKESGGRLRGPTP
jgi:hypothetical protein